MIRNWLRLSAMAVQPSFDPNTRATPQARSFMRRTAVRTIIWYRSRPTAAPAYWTAISPVNGDALLEAMVSAEPKLDLSIRWLRNKPHMGPARRHHRDLHALQQSVGFGVCWLWFRSPEGKPAHEAGTAAALALGLERLRLSSIPLYLGLAAQHSRVPALCPPRLRSTFFSFNRDRARKG